MKIPRARRPCGLCMFLLCLSLHAQSPGAARTISAASITMRGEPKYKTGFTHFDYVKADAPKGGKITLAALGTYDNFHRYAMRGDICAGWEYFYDTLMAGSDDETDTLYPLIAERIEYAADYSFITFTINPKAKDQEGHARLPTGCAQENLRGRSFNTLDAGRPA